MQSTNSRAADNDPAEVYNEDFYNPSYYEHTLVAARLILRHLWQYFMPATVVDVGCGHGSWLKAAHELGVGELVGYDGSWNDQSKMVDQAIMFKQVDLEQPFATGQKFDMAITLETAEHLRPEFADQFIQSMTRLADVVLFSAAYPGQGGDNHFNEQPHSYWGKRFLNQDYLPYDLFRQTFWADERINFFYRQNVFLYVKKGSALNAKLHQAGIAPLFNPAFLDCIHPFMFETHRQGGLYLTEVIKNSRHLPGGFRHHATQIVPTFVSAVRRRLFKS